jgi:hypothetical protein
MDPLLLGFDVLEIIDQFNTRMMSHKKNVYYPFMYIVKSTQKINRQITKSV